MPNKNPRRREGELKFLEEEIVEISRERCELEREEGKDTEGGCNTPRERERETGRENDSKR